MYPSPRARRRRRRTPRRSFATCACGPAPGFPVPGAGFPGEGKLSRRLGPRRQADGLLSLSRACVFKLGSAFHKEPTPRWSPGGPRQQSHQRTPGRARCRARACSSRSRAPACAVMSAGLKGWLASPVPPLARLDNRHSHGVPAVPRPAALLGQSRARRVMSPNNLKLQATFDRGPRSASETRPGVSEFSLHVTYIHVTALGKGMVTTLDTA